MFTLSPGVNVSEIDAATGIPAVSTTEAGIAGVFRWGPVSQRVLVTSEPDLANKFQKPSNLNAETWFVSANFLGYGNQLHVVRVSDGTSSLALFANTTAPDANTQTIYNTDHYYSGNVTFSANVAYVSKYPGALGNSLKVSVCDSVLAYSSSLSIVANSDVANTSAMSITVGSNSATVSVGFSGNGTQTTANTQAYALKNSLQVGDKIFVGNSSVGQQYLRVSSVGPVTGNSTISTFQVGFSDPYKLYTNWSSNTINRYWEFFDLVERAPGTSYYTSSFGNTAAVDEVHVVVVDEDGAFTGSPGNVLEVHKNLSRASDSKSVDGTSNYYKQYINDNSQYVWWANHNSLAPSNTAINIMSASTIMPSNYSMAGGTDGSSEANIAFGKIAAGYDILSDASSVDLSFVLGGKSRDNDGSTVCNYILDNVSAERKDCVAFLSPPRAAVVNNTGQELDSVIAFANSLRSTSYGFLDSGYKYQYDKYNDLYRWIPLNGDMAGLCVRTDYTNDPWWSPAGYNRGQVKNVTKLAWNPTKPQRDLMTKASVNAVITEKGQGTILFDDRTLLKVDSPFRALNVRRLFIVLEKAISTDAKYSLFEFNDDFTRSQFKNRTVPYLRDIQGRRGVTDFTVICDTTNNTPEVIDNEQFVGDIYIKPNRVIRGIQLNFVAVRNSVSFSEIVGQF